MLGADLSAPLTDRAAIEARLDLVALFERDAALRDEIRRALKAQPDVGRALGRIAAGRGSPRDLGALRDGLAEARRLHGRLERIGEPLQLLGELLPQLTGHGALVDQLTRALVPSPPVDADKGGAIAEGYDAALDALRASGGEGRRAIAALEAEYRQRPGSRASHPPQWRARIPCRSRRPPRRPADAPGSGFIHRQTLAGVVRFNAAELHDHAIKVGSGRRPCAGGGGRASGGADDAALARAHAIAATADALARLDVAAGLAERAVEGGWCRPGPGGARLLRGDRGTPSGGRGGGGAQRRAVRRQ
jgi:DNA mismatch repair protein MutS